MSELPSHLSSWNVALSRQHGVDFSPLFALIASHPHFQCYNMVIVDPDTKSLFIDTSSVIKLPTTPAPFEIGGYAVHIDPTSSSAVHHIPNDLRSVECLGFPPYLGRRFVIDPHVILADEQIEQIAYLFPDSSGLRVYVTGILDVLFPNAKAKKRSPKQYRGTTIGSRHYSCQIQDVNPLPLRRAKFHSERGTPVALGIKVYLPSLDMETWTAVAHTLVPEPEPKSFFWKAWPSRIFRTIRGLQHYKTASADSPRKSLLGTNIYEDGKLQQMIGTVCHTYNPSSPTSCSFPAGYDHDLSLISGPDLPALSFPQNYPKLDTSFATPEEALKAGYGLLVKAEQFADDSSIQPVLVAGTEYHWDRDSNGRLNIKRSLIWRTEGHSNINTLGTESAGALLCIGKKGDEVIKPVLFQTFETTFQGDGWYSHGGGQQGLREVKCFKGGYFLPHELKQATIAVGDAKEKE